MSELKTIEHEGKVYQIGALYEFSNYAESYWIVGRLRNIPVNKVTDFCFETIGECFKYIRECKPPIGTITDAPLVLEDGEWYMCRTTLGNLSGETVLQYNEDTTDNKGGYWVSAADYSGYAIKPLYKMIKA